MNDIEITFIGIPKFLGDGRVTLERQTADIRVNEDWLFQIAAQKPPGYPGPKATKDASSLLLTHGRK